MAQRYYGAKDLATIEKFNRELLGEPNKGDCGIIDQFVILYRTSVYETETNMYGEASDGKVYKQGVKLPVSLHYSARVPVVFGVKTPADLEEVYRFLKEINKDDFLKNEVVGIHKTNKKEFEIRVRSGDYIIVFGKCERLKQKFFNLKAFYSKAFLEDKMKTYKTINLTYHNQVVCTK